MDGERSPNNQDNGDGNPIETLSNMPSFYEHMTGNNTKEHTAYDSSAENGQSPRNTMDEYRKLRFDGKLPEGVRDYQDYQEFLEEQEARVAEYKEFDAKLFEGIRSIENEDDRNFATALLPFCYNSNFDRSGGVRGMKDLAMMDVMGTVVNYMHGNKSSSLKETVFNDLYKKYINPEHSNVDGYHDANNSISSSMKKMDELSLGQRIEKFDLPMARSLDDDDEDIIFILDNYETIWNNNWDFCDYRGRLARKGVDAKIAVSLANDLAEQISAGNDQRQNKIKLNYLENAFNFWQGDSFKNSLEYQKNQAFKSAVEKTERAMLEPNFDISKTVSYKDSGLLGLVGVKGLLEDYEQYSFSQKLYERSLEDGKKILAGEDWHKMNNPEIAVRFAKDDEED